MKPLVFWCRWHDAKLLLRGRSPDAVWGHLNFWKEERQETFRFDLENWMLTIRPDEADEQHIQLDEMGTELGERGTKQ